MANEQPRPGAIPGWGQQPETTPPAGPAPDAPTEAVPPPATPPTQPPQAASPSGPPPSEPPPPERPSAPEGPPEAPPPVPTGPPPATAPEAPAPVPQAPPPTTGWGAPPPAGVPPVAWNPQPAQASTSNGCLRACLILVVIGAVLLFVAIAGLAFLGNQLVQTVGVDSEGNIGRPCPFISDDELSTALGARAEALELTGLFDATIGLILDKRVLPDAEDCWITSDASTDASSATGRLARYAGGDAAAVFAQERANAAPTSQDQGGGVSLENPGYFAGDVPGLGDEAFCTGLSPSIQAGVLVRQGDTLVYVSLLGTTGDNGITFNIGTTEDGVTTAPEICAAAQEVARAILR